MSDRPRTPQRQRPGDDEQGPERAGDGRTRPTHDRPYLTNEQFGKFRELRSLDEPARAAVRERAREVRDELQGSPTLQTIHERWKALEQRGDRVGQLACAALWDGLQQRAKTERAHPPAADGGPGPGREQPPSPVAPRAGAVRAEPERPAQEPRLQSVQHHFVHERAKLEPAVRVRAQNEAFELVPQFPCTRDAALEAWTAWTRQALADRKAGVGSDAQRDTRHRAFAELWSAAHERGPIRDATHARDVLWIADRERAQGSALDRSLAAAVTKVRALHPDLRDSILESAAGLFGERVRQAEARVDVRDAFAKVREQPSKENVIHAMTLSVIASAPTQREYVDVVRRLPQETAQALELVAKERLDRYPVGANALAPARQDLARASIEDVVLATDATRQNAQVLALVVDELERRHAPRANWEDVGRDFAAELSKFGGLE